MHSVKNIHPRAFTMALAFILSVSIVWLVFGLIIAMNLHPSIPEGASLRWAMAGLAFLASGALLALYFLLRRRTRLAYLPALSLLGIIMVLSVLDEFGAADLIVLILHLVPLLLLLKERRWYFDPKQVSSNL